MGRKPRGDTHAREPYGISARNANEGETPKPKSWRARWRSERAELLARLIDAPVGKNLGTRRVAPLDSRQGMRKVLFVLKSGNRL